MKAWLLAALLAALAHGERRQAALAEHQRAADGREHHDLDAALLESSVVAPLRQYIEKSRECAGR